MRVKPWLSVDLPCQPIPSTLTLTGLQEPGTYLSMGEMALRPATVAQDTIETLDRAHESLAAPCDRQQGTGPPRPLPPEPASPTAQPAALAVSDPLNLGTSPPLVGNGSWPRSLTVSLVLRECLGNRAIDKRHLAASCAIPFRWGTET